MEIAVSSIGTDRVMSTRLMPLSAYIMAEGKVDAEGVKNAVDNVQDAVGSVQGMESSKPYDSWSPEGRKLYDDAMASLKAGERDE